MRENLKKARKEKNMTQKQVAECLNIAERYYKQIESGERLGSVEIWDNLEDLFNIHQEKTAVTEKYYLIDDMKEVEQTALAMVG